MNIVQEMFLIRTFSKIGERLAFILCAIFMSTRSCTVWKKTLYALANIHAGS